MFEENQIEVALRGEESLKLYGLRDIVTGIRHPTAAYYHIAARPFLRKRLFGTLFKSMRVQTLFSSKQEERAGTSFCIVHWNAPGFLKLNLEKLRAHHPEGKVYVFDNHSTQGSLDAALSACRRDANLTFFSCKNDYSSMWSSLRHSMALQFLLNYSATQSDPSVVFLDQDSILCGRVDALTSKLRGEVLLIGVRDYVEIPKDYGPLRKGLMRKWPNWCHPSFMMVQPVRVCSRFGKQSLIGNGHEPYHGNALASARTLFLESKMHEEIPFLTRYMFQGKTYAWHSWYSRLLALDLGLTNGADKLGIDTETGTLDGLPVSWIRECLRQAYEFMARL